MAKTIRIGTRASRLAMVQTEWVAGRLREIHPGLEIAVEQFRTTGDRDRATPLARMPGVGFFVKELETALLDGRIDLAVHSMKDVPSRPPEGLEVEASVPVREDPRDCLVTPAGIPLLHLAQGAIVGSSSPRRRAMLLSVRPDLEFMDLRGNVETRLRKLSEGLCHATVLAMAGLGRLGMLDRRMAPQEAAVMLGAAGQGALGLEFRSDDDSVRQAIAAIDDPPSRWAVVAERALVRRLGAGCQTPLGALARAEQDGRLIVDAWLLADDGRESLRQEARGRAADAAELGTALAESLLVRGAARFIKSGHAAEDGACDA